jgi:hypothetical protein
MVPHFLLPHASDLMFVRGVRSQSPFPLIGKGSYPDHLADPALFFLDLERLLEDPDLLGGLPQNLLDLALVLTCQVLELEVMVVRLVVQVVDDLDKGGLCLELLLEMLLDLIPGRTKGLYSMVESSASNA